MNDIISIIQTLEGAVVNNPGRVLPVLAFACAVTMITAIVSDTLLRKKQLARQRKPVESPKRPNTLPR